MRDFLLPICAGLIALACCVILIFCSYQLGRLSIESVVVSPEPEIKLVYIYMMEVPYLDSDFRGLLHVLHETRILDDM